MSAIYLTPEGYKASGLTLDRYLATALRVARVRGVPVRADNPWMRTVLHAFEREHRA